MLERQNDLNIKLAYRKTHQKQRGEFARLHWDQFNALILAGTSGYGKALALDSKISTPNGWVEMRDIKVGDVVHDPDGGTAHVTGVYPQPKQTMYKVTFSDGTYAYATGDHLWHVQWDGGESVLTTEQIIKTKWRGYSIPMTKPVEYTERESLKIHPYVLGLLLGGGHIAKKYVQFTAKDEELIQFIRELEPDWIISKYNGREYAYGIRGAIEHMRYYGLDGVNSSTKFIPDAYLYTSSENRLALLQGLLDIDGCCYDGTSIEYVTVSDMLAMHVVFLVQSLGGIATISNKATQYTRKDGAKINGKTAHSIFIRLPMQGFRLQRKIDIVKRTKYTIQRYIRSIDAIEESEAQCITVNSKRNLFITDNFIVTHNSQSLAYYLSQWAYKGVQIIPCEYDSTMGSVQSLYSRIEHLQPAFLKPFATTATEIADRFDYIRELVRWRQSHPETSQHALRTRPLDQQYYWFPVLMVIDEFSNMYIGQTRRLPIEEMINLVNTARKHNIRFVFSGQTWSQMSTNGIAALRGACTHRIMHRLDGKAVGLITSHDNTRIRNVVENLDIGRVYYRNKEWYVPSYMTEEQKSHVHAAAERYSSHYRETGHMNNEEFLWHMLSNGHGDELDPIFARIRTILRENPEWSNNKVYKAIGGNRTLRMKQIKQIRESL